LRIEKEHNVRVSYRKSEFDLSDTVKFDDYFLLPSIHNISLYEVLFINHGKAGGLSTSWVAESSFQSIPCLPKPW